MMVGVGSYNFHSAALTVFNNLSPAYHRKDMMMILVVVRVFLVTVFAFQYILNLDGTLTSSFSFFTSSLFCY